MRRIAVAALLTILVAGPVAAQSGVSRAGSDMQPAAPTQRSAPDGGRQYDYPPNTGAILRPQDRTPYDVPPNKPEAKSSTSEPQSGTTNPSKQAPEQVGR